MIMPRTISSLACCLVLVLGACSDDDQKQGGDLGPPVLDGTSAPDAKSLPDLGQVDLQLTIDTYPAVDGSTSAHPLGMIIACKLLGMPYKWDLYYDMTKRIMPDPDPGKPQDKELADKITSKVIHNGTHGSYVGLIEKKTDLALVARLPSTDELEQAKQHGVILEPRAIAMDAFVFIVNHQNPIDSLTVQQIQEIYTGKLTTWDQVGGPQQKINPYQRNDNSGSQELMKSLVMKGLQMVDAPDMVLMGMMGPINAISEDQWGLGYSVYFYEQFMAPNEKLKLCGVGGVVPGFETIQSRAYPFATEVYAVIRGDLDPESNARKLRDWLLSSAGQAVVKESGYVPVVGAGK